MTKRGRDETREDGVVWGLILVATGVVFLLAQFDVLPFDFWRDGWPFIVIAIGVAQLVAARSPRSIGSGVTMMLIGGWFLIAQTEWRGLGWRETWPLALVAVGAGMVARSIAMPFFRKKEEDRGPNR